MNNQPERINPIGPASDAGRKELTKIIHQWNDNRLDLFNLTEPDENLRFFGNMRFYYKENDKLTTKCIRVWSDDEASKVINILIEKFRPDMRMLSTPNYSLYELSGGEERKLKLNEKPLLVQLNWHSDDREGRFLLKNEDEPQPNLDKHVRGLDKKRLSKREKKQLKKEQETSQALEKLKRKGKNVTASDAASISQASDSLPDSSFHRSISNPEAVMRRRRQQKLTKKLEQFQEGDTGGALKIFGEELNPSVMFKTLLLSVEDSADNVVKQMLKKYAMDKEDSKKFCLVQTIIPDNPQEEATEITLQSHQCPLKILMSSPAGQRIRFSVKRLSSAFPPPESDSAFFFDPLTGDRYKITYDVTHIGCDDNDRRQNFLKIPGHEIRPLHCVILKHDDNEYLLSPINEASVAVNGIPISQRTSLKTASTVRLGSRSLNFYFKETDFDDNKVVMRRRDHQTSGPAGAVFSTHRQQPGPLHGSSSNIVSPGQQLPYDARSEMRPISISTAVHQTPAMHPAPIRAQATNLPILPATIEFLEEHEDLFLQTVISQDFKDVSTMFALSPAFIFYLAARYRASTSWRPEMEPIVRAERLSMFLIKVANTMQRIIMDTYDEPGQLSFLLANCSELLHFLRNDRNMSPYCVDAQDVLESATTLAFHTLAASQHERIAHRLLPGLQCAQGKDLWGFAEKWDMVMESMDELLQCMEACGVNLSIINQLFSLLFQSINAWCLNSMLHSYELCELDFGRLMMKLLTEQLHDWSKDNQLNTASELHLKKIEQACALIVFVHSWNVQVPNLEQHAQTINSKCYALNSKQLRSLLKHSYVPEEIKHRVVKTAEVVTDSTIKKGGGTIELQETLGLIDFPFTIPEEGCCCDIIRSVPEGLPQFLHALINQKIVIFTIHPLSQGYWNIYFHNMADHASDQARSSPQQAVKAVAPTNYVQQARNSYSPSSPNEKQQQQHDVVVNLYKGSSGLGLSIVAQRGDKESFFIYVKNIVPGSTADKEGTLEPGDLLLRVNGVSLAGVSQERAAEIIKNASQNRTSLVSFDVIKHGAIKMGAATNGMDYEKVSSSSDRLRYESEASIHRDQKLRDSIDSIRNAQIREAENQKAQEYEKNLSLETQRQHIMQSQVKTHMPPKGVVPNGSTRSIDVPHDYEYAQVQKGDRTKQTNRFKPESNPPVHKPSKEVRFDMENIKLHEPEPVAPTPPPPPEPAPLVLSKPINAAIDATLSSKNTRNEDDGNITESKSMSVKVEDLRQAKQQLKGMSFPAVTKRLTNGKSGSNHVESFSQPMKNTLSQEKIFTEKLTVMRKEIIRLQELDKINPLSEKERNKLETLNVNYSFAMKSAEVEDVDDDDEEEEEVEQEVVQLDNSSRSNVEKVVPVVAEKMKPHFHHSKAEDEYKPERQKFQDEFLAQRNHARSRNAAENSAANIPLTSTVQKTVRFQLPVNGNVTPVNNELSNGDATTPQNNTPKVVGKFETYPDLGKHPQNNDGDSEESPEFLSFGERQKLFAKQSNAGVKRGELISKKERTIMTGNGGVN